MTCRLHTLPALNVTAVILATFLVPALPAQTPATKAKTWTAPRTADGKPDFSGYWTNTTQTSLQRPPALGNKEFLTDAEMDALENNKRDTDAQWKTNKGAGVTKPVPTGTDPASVAEQIAAYNAARQGGDYNQVFLEPDRKVLPNKRTSIVTDPKDGQLPPLTPEAKRKFEEGQAYHKAHYHWGPEDQTSIERCITWITSGPPMLPSFYNNNYHIVQTKDHLAIAVEMVHDVRIIPIGGRPHGDARQWMGDSIGHWEGDTLVVETTNFNGKRGWFAAPQFDGNDLRRPDEKMKVTERFSRTAQGILNYAFTVDDPGIYTRPWSGEVPLRAFDGPVYEYACHEGNHAMELTLSGARSDERAAAAKSSR